MSDKNKWVINLTDTCLPQDVIDLVALGPNHSSLKISSNHEVTQILKNVESVIAKSE